MSSRFLKTILPVVAVVFLVAGYLYLTGKMKLNNEQLAEIEEIAETMQENETIETETENIDWKTYRNEEQETKNTNKTVEIRGIISEDQKSISYDLIFNETIKKDIDKMFPSAKYDSSVVVPDVFSYIPEHGRVVLYRYVDGTEILLDAYVFDIKTETIKKLANLNMQKYIYGGESLWEYSQMRFSPNGNMVVFNNGEEISVFDFINDREINVAKVNNENERFLSNMGEIGEINKLKEDTFTWLNENTLQYPVYDRNTKKLLEINPFHF